MIEKRIVTHHLTAEYLFIRKKGNPVVKTVVSYVRTTYENINVSIILKEKLMAS